MTAHDDAHQALMTDAIVPQQIRCGAAATRSTTSGTG